MSEEFVPAVPAPRASRFQFSVRTLLTWTVVVAVALVVHRNRVNVHAYDWALFCMAGVAFLFIARLYVRQGDSRTGFLLRTLGFSLVVVGILQAM